MTKSLAIIFATFYMLSTTVCSEVLKLPILIEHYMEYEGDFVDFMIHHYGGHEKDADWETDQKLPFIKISQNLSIDFSLPSSKLAVEGLSAIFFLEKSTSISRENRFSYNYLSDIFQPPRIN
ncbi:hypothetical protein [Myroides indicus]|uniref:Uncharacterized protein n=1 Tax=Myroides indicus TaxID=1323422 RepID=A0A4R7F1B0_9FLAO|nr:hypothetical protein [Myroides indicus]TDS56964.1 hypothetical protein C8P70_11754 [Myroides indicus]